MRTYDFRSLKTMFPQKMTKSVQIYVRTYVRFHCPYLFHGTKTIHILYVSRQEIYNGEYSIQIHLIANILEKLVWDSEVWLEFCNRTFLKKYMTQKTVLSIHWFTFQKNTFSMNVITSIKIKTFKFPKIQWMITL